MKFAQDWDRWDIHKQRSYQERRLKAFLETQVVRFSPFYSRLHKEGKFPIEKFKTLEDLKNLPFTTKSDMVPTVESPTRPRDFILQPDPHTVSSQLTLNRKLELVSGHLLHGKSFKTQIYEEYLPIFFTATTGRSAGQVPFVYSYYDLLRLKETGRRLFTVSGMKPGVDTLLNVFPYAPHLGFWAVYHGAEQSIVPTFHSGGGKVLGTGKILNLFNSLKPTVLAGVPGYIYHLLRIASENKMDLSQITLVCLGAERTTPGHRIKFREFLESCGAKNVAILSTFGFTEARMAFIECREGDQMGYHLYPDMAIFELINPETLEPAGEGEPGEVVYTSLDSRGTVVIRFLTGDYSTGGIVYEPCPACGRTVPRLDSNLTRLSNQKELHTTKVKGTIINLNYMDEVIHSFMEIVEWQVEIGKVNNDPLESDSVTLYVSLRPNTHEESFKDRLKREFTHKFEISPNSINIEKTESILSRLGMESELKEKRIVDIRGESTN
jgi:phenylacetate-CoA ligase